MLVLGLSTNVAQATLRAKVYSSAVVGGQVVTDPSASPDPVRFTSRAGVALTLQLDPRRLNVSNPSRGASFVAVTSEDVNTVLAQMASTVGLDLDIDVYLLPGLDPAYPSSFCVGTEIFLNPTFDVVSLEVVAYSLVHEIGHAVQHARVPRSGGVGWTTYRRLRRLSAAHHEAAAHRDRPGEIFAEDFRVLFGGQLANRNGSIENPDLPMPQHVVGLANFFARAFNFRPGQPPARASCAPNPFNPMTTIRIDLVAQELLTAAPLHVEIFDARGRRVRVLGPLTPESQVQVEWNGRDDRGQRIASGRYSYRVVRDGRSLARGAATVLK